MLSTLPNVRYQALIVMEFLLILGIKGRLNMRILRSSGKTFLLLTVSCLTLASVADLRAQAILDPSSWLSAGPEGDKQRQSEMKKEQSTREYKPMQIGNWLVDSGIYAGLVYDSNIYSSRYNVKSATGLSLSPTITGRYSDGGQNTSFYLTGEARRFNVSDDITTFGGRIGVGNSVEIQRGVIWKALVQLGRSQDDGGSVNATGTGAGNTGVYVKPINSNSLFAATSILSRVDYQQFSGFASAGLSGNSTRFEDAELSDGTKLSQATRDTDVYTATGRLGWNVTPLIYTYLEPSVTWQHTPSVSNGDTTNYRFSAGLGTDRINLVRGEVFAGYAIQSFNDISGQEQNGLVYGGRVTWFATKDITFNLTGDDSLGVTASSVSGSTQVYTTRTKSVAADLSYLFDRRISAAFRTSFSNVDYSETNRTDDVLRYGADLSYMITANFGARIGYTSVKVDSSSNINNFNRDVYSIAINVKF